MELQKYKVINSKLQLVKSTHWKTLALRRIINKVAGVVLLCTAVLCFPCTEYVARVSNVPFLHPLKFIAEALGSSNCTVMQ